MRRVVEFLKLLGEHNDREWFRAHRALYEESERVFADFAQKIIAGISAFDPSVGDLTLKDCTYRIFRDIRFSPDKSPYKTWKGVFVCPHGKKSGYAGYYLHIEPERGCFLYAGLHLPEKKVLQSVREEIMDNGDAILKAVRAARGFSLCTDGTLKRNPKDFPETGKYDKLLRLKDEISIESPVSFAELESEGFAEKAVERFRTAREFVGILNRAAQYAFEEM